MAKRTFAARTFAARTFASATLAGVVTIQDEPDIPGIEFRVNGTRPQWGLSQRRMMRPQWRVDGTRPQWKEQER